MVAALGGHVDVARLLVEHGANVNASKKDGVTALMAAAMGGQVDVARL